MRTYFFASLRFLWYGYFRVVQPFILCTYTICLACLQPFLCNITKSLGWLQGTYQNRLSAQSVKIICMISKLLAGLPKVW